MAITFHVETTSGIKLKGGFKKLDTARKYACTFKGHFDDEGRYDIYSDGKSGENYRGMVIRSGMFLKECVWVPASNPKNLKYIVNKDGSVTRK